MSQILKVFAFSAGLTLWAAPSTAHAAPCECPTEVVASRSMLATGTAEVADTEADLAKTYRRVRAQTPMEFRAQLGKAQQAWLTYRAAECRFAAGGMGGKGSVTALACTAAMNRDRIGQLDHTLMRGK